jgi:hypothetical protein
VSAFRKTMTEHTAAEQARRDYFKAQADMVRAKFSPVRSPAISASESELLPDDSQAAGVPFTKEIP